LSPMETEAFLKATDPNEELPRVPQERPPNFIQFVYKLVRDGDLNAVLEAERLLKTKIITKEIIRGFDTVSHFELDRVISLLGPLRSLIPKEEEGYLFSIAKGVAASALHRGLFISLYPLLLLIPNPFDSVTLRRVVANCRLRDEAGVVSEDLKKILEYCHEETEIKPSDYGLLETQHSMRTIAEIYQERLPKDGRERVLALQALYSVDPRYQYISELLAIQSPTRREEFCPYVHQVDLLLQNMYYQGIELDHPVYRKGLGEYFRAFGLHNLPILAQTVVEVFACDDRRPEIATENLERTDSRLVQQARQLLGVKAGCTPKEFIAEMKLFQARLQETLLADGELPTGLEHSPLGMELFNALIPNAGSYHVKDDRPSLITETRKLTERFPIPAFLQQREVSVVARMNEDLIDKEVSDRVMDLNRQKYEKLSEEPLITFLAPWNEALKLMGTPETILQYESWWIARVRTRLERERAQLQEKTERIVNEKGREAVQKQVMVIEKKILRATQLEERLRTEPSEPDIRKAFFEKVLRALQELCTDETGKVDTRELVSIAKEEVYALFVGLMREHAPTHIEHVLRPIIPAGLPISAVEQVRTENWIKYFYEEYLEHFSRAHPVIDLDEEDLEKAVQTMRQIPEDLAPLMHRLWRTRGTAELFREAGYDKEKKVPDHPIVNVARAIQALQRKSEALLQGTEEKEYIPLKISPCHGMARVLSGDIADACFHQHRADLARGSYPGITALIFSLPGKDRELAGSALCIDTMNEADERVLVLRALNPTEAVLQRDIQAESVVKAVTDYLIEAAKTSLHTDSARPVKEVRVCIGVRGGHSTNRQSIHVAEERLLAGAWKKAERMKILIDNSVTNFNGYPIWRAGSTVCIWRAPEESTS
ncbi:hypothetical protein KBA73_05280, partial [Patescibacteria group bacterium]|nr:hypothetical protein [Patescibacteria group bacterium]